ncbi:hypothetical protein Poli38472_011804 [Pythium oligandrum]|uniref:6,7-dimethyl-8-ribityllumazine synthase n=1 Tax=Pythium oligandrum TaxID=41045 RepID=A0A8K1FDD7_PYTOL|nr:hypothetical protein Poli38472_011804 [Pythium oligandrum]|eukprot:TMW58216.1 hypothetical protein Poli38472_011804 [Pythium oligandrum]
MATPATHPTTTGGSETHVPSPVLMEPPGAGVSTRKLDGRGLKIAIVSTRWYEKEVTHPLVESCKNELLAKGVESANIKCFQVPGAYELPFAASRVIHTKQQHMDCVICIGCMVKGGTMAYEFVSEAVTTGLMKLNVMTATPVVLGLLTCTSEEQAKACASNVCVEGHSGKKKCNYGVEWAQEAIELAHLKRSTSELIEKKRVSHCKQEGCSCSCHCQQCKCHTCSCEGECKCSSCEGQHKAQKKQTPLTQAFDEALAKCSGCGSESAKCNCKGCNCASCAHKQEQQQGELECGGCGHQKKSCTCTTSHTKTGVTTTRHQPAESSAPSP